MTCDPHSFEVFSELHQCIHCGIRIVDHQHIEKLEKRLADLQELYDDLVGCHEDAVHRFVKAEARIVELEAIKKALIAELPPIVKESDKRWPHEPCGRNLAQCPYDKSQHIAYFRSVGELCQ
jgi:hypothetical protein